MTEQLLTGFWKAAQEQPENLAIASVDFSMTYGELSDVVTKSVEWLGSLGVRAGQRVALKLPPELHPVFTLGLMELGVASAGYVSTEVFERDGFDWLITQSLNTSIPIEKQVTISQEVLVAIAKLSGANGVGFGSSQDVVRIIYSSGTTGLPKGVPFSVEGLLFRVEAARRNWMPQQPFMGLLGPLTVSGFQAMIAQLLSGNKYLVPGPGAKNAFEIARHQVRSIKASPSQLRALLDHCRADNIKLPSLEIIQSAGSFLPATLAKELSEYFYAEVVNLYGSTECGTVAVRVGMHDEPNLAGTLVPESTVEILDNEGRPGAGEGRIRIKTPALSSGYLSGNPSDLVGFHDGWFYPGDLGHIDNKNQLWVTGRSTELVNIGGVKLNLNEVELKLQNAHPTSDIAAVDFLGPEGEELLGIAVTNSETVTANELEASLRNLLPRGIDLVVLAIRDIPRNAAGKPLRPELRELFVASDLRPIRK